MVFLSSSRSSTLCFLLILLHCTHAAPDNLFLKVAAMRTLPSALLKDSIPAASLRRRRKRAYVQSPASLVASIKTKFRSTGYFYGLPENLLNHTATKKKKKESLNNLMNNALTELKSMRTEMEALRKDLRAMKRQLGQEGDITDDDQPENSFQVPNLLAKSVKQREWDKIGLEVEHWAEKLLFEEGETEEDGWKEVRCSKLCSHFNRDGRIKCYLKWMKDSRGAHADPNDDEEYPCMKVFATIDAPMDKVCEYLADEKSLPDYNDLVVKHKDLEDVSAHSKICWGQSPKILFIKPRDFVTFCHHRWLRDGTQVIVNQACNHDEYQSALQSDLRAFALRGANFISSHPEDPGKTRIAIVAHANPGNDISPWMCRLAVNNMAPIEPFKLFYKINKYSQRYESDPNRTQLVNHLPGRSGRPGGMSQLGYACFWPHGGGLKEGIVHAHYPDRFDPSADDSDEHGENQSNPTALTGDVCDSLGEV